MSSPPVETFPIVMADDDPDDRLLVHDAFYECAPRECIGFAEDGDSLFVLLRRSKPLPRLILLDWNMPRKNGSETLQALKKDTLLSPIPVVVLTTSTDSSDQELAHALGATEFRTKPSTFEALTAFAHEMMRRYAPEAQR